MSKRRSARQEAFSRRHEAPKRPSGKVLAAVAAVVVVLVGTVVVISIAQSAPGPSRTAMSSSADDMAAKGPSNAKVTIVEYSDFQCPYCGFFAQGTGRQIDEQYVSTGKVRFVYKNRAFIGPESNWAAEAAFCAGDQGKFWQYHDKLFASQAGENKGAFAKDRLKGFAAELGLDGAAFGTCLDSGKYSSRVREETAESERRGVRGTPAFFVNSQKIEGNQPFAIFRAALETELQKAQ